MQESAKPRSTHKQNNIVASKRSCKSNLKRKRSNSNRQPATTGSIFQVAPQTKINEIKSKLLKKTKSVQLKVTERKMASQSERQRWYLEEKSQKRQQNNVFYLCSSALGDSRCRSGNEYLPTPQSRFAPGNLRNFSQSKQQTEIVQ